MANPKRPLFADLQQELTRLGGDLSELITLRSKLAWMEIQDDLASTRSLAVGVAAALVMALTSLPVLTVALAHVLDGCLSLGHTAWMLVIGLTLFAGGTLTAWASWRRFRRRLVAFQETLEELREDIVWLKEWAGHESVADENEERP